MAILSKSVIKANIQSELADNNAGNISASDVRHNMVDTVDSINNIVANGDFDTTNPFVGSDVRAKIDTNGNFGAFIAESGVIYPYGGRQLEAYPGTDGISHNDLSNLTVGNPHTQYIHTNGQNKMEANLAMDTFWINSSGATQIASSNDRGLKFQYINSNSEHVRVGNKTTVKYDIDNSTMNSAKGVAQAWVNFNGSGNMSIRSSYNVSKVQKTGSPGKFKVFFKTGLFTNGNYIAVANSNSRSDNDNAEDFNINTVGIVERTKDYITFYVLNDAGNYVDASVNDLVVFGNASGVTPDATAVVEVL
jgi:hypothetical protein